jgi:hypothetical protein
VGLRIVQRAGRFKLIDAHSSGLLGPIKDPVVEGAEGILFMVFLFLVFRACSIILCVHEIINYCRPIDTLVFACVSLVAGEGVCRSREDTKQYCM